ncbi:MAG: ATP-binding protein [Cyclobacteriaceae bacterium]|nr:ATP-binding protein [Cyclobacteriaceae bacterium]
MAREMIDWARLEPYRSSKSKSFEQLVYQIVSRSEESANLWPIDDSGGGDGVEFFLIKPDKKETGWQVKFYDDNGRLTPSRKSKIIDSLKKALSVHPNMTTWILCTIADLTPTERNWFENVLKGKIPGNRTVKLIHWGQTEIFSFLNKPGFEGIKSHFFNSLELDHHWFNTSFEKFFHPIALKFDQDLHTVDSELEFYYTAPLLVNNIFNGRLKSYLRNLNENLEKLEDNLLQLENINDDGIAWMAVKDIFVKKGRELVAASKEAKGILDLFLLKVNPNGLQYVTVVKYQQYSALLEDLISQLNKIGFSQKIQFQKGYELQHQDDNRLDRVIRLVNSPSYHGAKIVEEIKYFFEHSKIGESKRLHILGGAGLGKTHLSIALAKEQLDKGQPAIFIPASKFNDSSSIERQILDLLDIRSNYSFKEFLDELQIKAVIHNCRIPLIFDGLNESLGVDGKFNRRWKDDLDGIEAQITAYPNLVLFTTSRTSYRKAIWERNWQINEEGFHEVYGFNDQADIQEMVGKYFSKYKIVSEITYLSLQQFRKPLLLKIFCETKNHRKQDVVHVTLGLDSIYDIFEAYISTCDVRIFEKLKEQYGPINTIKKVASKSILGIGKAFWESDIRGITFENFKLIVDAKIDEDFWKSKSKALLDEELLLLRDWADDHEYVGFTYDLMAGYVIASYLIYHYSDDINTLITSKEFHQKVLKGPANQGDPYHEDILECLSALLPKKKGVFFHDIVPKEKEYNKLFNSSVITMLSLSPSVIDANQRDLIKSIFKKRKQRGLLLRHSQETLLVPGHPLNMELWSELLRECSMRERDLLWSESLRHRDLGFYEALFKSFEITCLSSIELDELSKLKCQTIAKFLMWCFTSTKESINSGAAKSLYWYGRRFPYELVELFKSSISINDPMIFERLGSVMYGVILAKVNVMHDEFSNGLFEDLCRFIYTNLYSELAKYSTTNILINDFALNILSLGISANPTMLSDEEKARIKLPIKEVGIKKWGESKDRNKHEYREGNSLIDYFSEKNKMREFGFGDEYRPTIKYKKALSNIRWRAYQLGYDFKSFESIDTEIAQFRGYSNNSSKSVLKYGEKYTLIAFYELRGFFLSPKTLSELRYESRIDPTYPDFKPDIPIITDDFLEDKSLDMKTWLGHHALPGIQKFFKVESLKGNQGPWILIYGSHDQYDKPSNKEIYTHVQTFFIHNKDLPFVKSHLNSIKFITDITPTNRTVFHGEVPRSPIFESNNFEAHPIELRTYKGNVTQMVSKLFRAEVKLSTYSESKFWKMIKEKYSNSVILHESGYIFFTSGKNDVDPVKFEMQKAGLTQRKIPEVLERDIKEEINLEIFSPQVHINDSMAIAKEISEELDLINQPQSANLLERPSKKVASIFQFSGEETYINNEKVHFIRKDLLDRYLKAHDLTMIWNVLGERQYRVPYPTQRTKLDVEPWAKFAQSIIYVL